VSERGLATKDYIELSELLFGSGSDVNGGIEYFTPRITSETQRIVGDYTSPGVFGIETDLGEPDVFVRFTLAGQDYEAISYPVFMKESKIISHIVTSAKEYITTNSPDGLIEEPIKFLNTLEDYGDIFGSIDLPPFGISIDGEKSLLIQWTMPESRIGVVFEENYRQSSWYILSDEKSDGTTAWGFLHKIGIPKLVSLIINQISD
jgi:hypothetical protein